MVNKFQLKHDKCPANRNERMRNPMCSLPAKQFEPHKKPPSPTPPKPPPAPTPKIPQFPPNYSPPAAIDVPNYTPPPMLNVKGEQPTVEDHPEFEQTRVESKADPKLLSGRRASASHEGPLPQEVVDSARMVTASYHADSANDKGENFMDAAQDYMNNNGLDGWTLNRNPNLSSTHMLLLEQDGEIPKVRMAYRGTQKGADWLTNLAHGTGVTESAPQQMALRVQEANIKTYLQEKHGDDWRTKTDTKTTGHSKGGAHAILGADNLEVASLTLNPSIPKDRARVRGKGTHQTWSTTGDPLVGFKAHVVNQPNYQHNTIDTKQKVSNNPVLDQHSLKHFSDPAGVHSPQQEGQSKQGEPSQIEGAPKLMPQTGLVGASIAAGEVADEYVDKLEQFLKLENIDPNVQSLIHGAISGVAIDAVAGKMGYSSNFKTKLRSALSGMGALLLTNNMNSALRKAGMSQDQADALSAGAGGAAAGFTDEFVDKIVAIFAKLPAKFDMAFAKSLGEGMLRGAGVAVALAVFTDLVEEMPGGQSIGQIIHAFGEGVAGYMAVHAGYDSANFAAQRAFQAYQQYRPARRGIDVPDSTGTELAEPSVEPPVDTPSGSADVADDDADDDAVTKGGDEGDAGDDAVGGGGDEGGIELPELPEKVPDVPVAPDVTEEPQVPATGGADLAADAGDLAADDLFEAAGDVAVDTTIASVFGASQLVPVVGEIVDAAALAVGAVLTVKDLVAIFEDPKDFIQNMGKLAFTPSTIKMALLTGADVDQITLDAKLDPTNIPTQYEKDHPKKGVIYYDPEFAQQYYYNLLLHPTTDEERQRSIKLFSQALTAKAKKEGQDPAIYAGKILKAQQDAKQQNEEFEKQSEINAAKMGISKELYQEYVAYIKQGGEENAREQLNMRLSKLASEQGFDNVSDYLQFTTHAQTMQELQSGEQSRAATEYKLALMAQGAGYESVDAYLLQANPKYRNQFDVNSNELVRAANLNLTLEQYTEYIHQRSQGASYLTAMDAANAIHGNVVRDLLSAADGEYAAFGAKVSRALDATAIATMDDAIPTFDQPYVSPYQDMNPLLIEAYKDAQMKGANVDIANAIAAGADSINTDFKGVSAAIDDYSANHPQMAQ